MKITKEETKKIAELIKINLSEKEIAKITKQLDVALLPAKVLKELETDNVPTTSQTTGLKNIVRKDIVGESLSVENALLNAKNTEGGYIVVKKFIND